MTEITIQRTGELIRGVIEILWSKADGLPSREIIASIPDIIKLTDYEMGVSPSTRTPRYERIIRLAIVPLVRIGWMLKNDKGRWRLTDEGRGAIRRFVNAHDFYTEALRLSEDGKHGAPEILVALETIEEIAWEYIFKYIQTRSLTDVRRLIAVLLEALHYHIVWVAPPEKSRGLVDLIANVDPLGVQAYRILVQVKHKGQPVTVEGLKSLLSILGQNDFGLLLSTGGFTNDARDELTKVEYRKINAMDLEKFYDMWVKNYEALSTDAHELLPLRHKIIRFLASLD